jgi:hypothetical protein
VIASPVLFPSKLYAPLVTPPSGANSGELISITSCAYVVKSFVLLLSASKAKLRTA